MKMTLEMPQVRGCRVIECLYNRGERCHARAITVGDSGHPRCDTFTKSSSHVVAVPSAGVGACKVSVCKYNGDFECQAGNVTLDRCGDHADCTTFEMKA